MTKEVTVTNAHWNSNKKTFNGQPFSDNPPWIKEIITKGFLGIIPRKKHELRKHAIWAVNTQKGVLVAEPGDKISIDPIFGVVVTKLRTNILTWDEVKPEAPETSTVVKPPITASVQTKNPNHEHETTEPMKTKRKTSSRVKKVKTNA